MFILKQKIHDKYSSLICCAAKFLRAGELCLLARKFTERVLECITAPVSRICRISRGIAIKKNICNSFAGVKLFVKSFFFLRGGVEWLRMRWWGRLSLRWASTVSIVLGLLSAGLVAEISASRNDNNDFFTQLQPTTAFATFYGNLWAKEVTDRSRPNIKVPAVKPPSEPTAQTVREPNIKKPASPYVKQDNLIAQANIQDANRQSNRQSKGKLPRSAEQVTAPAVKGDVKAYSKANGSSRSQLKSPSKPTSKTAKTAVPNSTSTENAVTTENTVGTEDKATTTTAENVAIEADSTSDNIAEDGSSEQSPPANSDFYNNPFEAKEPSGSFLALWLRLMGILVVFALVAYALIRFLKSREKVQMKSHALYNVVASFPLAVNKTIKIVKIVHDYFVIVVTQDNVIVLKQIEDKTSIDELKLYEGGVVRAEEPLFGDIFKKYSFFEKKQPLEITRALKEKLKKL
ncbi:hypothetical protein COTS27_00773 [Spirochaetota bacterium]|nr:hypothetical protein COTS27_00773 [Spirochaetota bacterium]